jgi:hypothetical protein
VNVRELAKVLRKRDPGKRVGGVTLVATKTGAVLRGARGRINFELALGRGEVLIGGATHDELGAYVGVRGARIYGGGGPDLIHGMGFDQRLYGGAGNDMIYGGPGDDTINGGGGNDRIMALHGVTTVTTGSGASWVDVRDGQGNDRVSCAAGGQTRVLADRGDRLSRGCRRVTASAARRIFAGMATQRRAATQPAAHTTDAVSGDGSEVTTVRTGPGASLVDVRDGDGNDRVSCAPGRHTRVLDDPVDRLSGGCRRVSASVASQIDALIGRQPQAHVAQVSGNGSNDYPYTGECPAANQPACPLTSFAARTLPNLWSNEYVPAYACPYDVINNPNPHSFLISTSYAPGGTTLPDGVGVLGLGPIGVSITQSSPGNNNQRNGNDPYLNYAGGTPTGPLESSATNWQARSNSYQVQLHCSWDPDTGYVYPNLSP